MRRFIGNPWVLKQACRLLGEFAAWFGKAEILPASGANASVVGMYKIHSLGACAHILLHLLLLKVTCVVRRCNITFGSWEQYAFWLA